jgi:hypothetical protein
VIEATALTAFCADMPDELALHSADPSWACGARALCEMFVHTHPVRFTQHARGKENSAVADGGHRLLLRWKSANNQSCASYRVEQAAPASASLIGW